jgi:hypothetical protein
MPDMICTLEDWRKVLKPEEQLIVQASTVDGSDGLTQSSIGMSWRYVEERGNFRACQIGDHSKLVLCAVSSTTDVSRRGGEEINREMILESLEKHGIRNTEMSSSDYFEELPKHQFVISPEGNGIDCHRHYEALMAGCVPIVEHSELIVSKYGDVPILYTRDYTEITPDFLVKKHEEMLRAEWDFSKLFIESWDEEEQERIRLRGNHWCNTLANSSWYQSY